ncbi:MAG: amidohydrolase family protein [Phycisphaerae bacterium]|nr:amidohydrolase family protein [Phycisphaerae bacterium]
MFIDIHVHAVRIHGAKRWDIPWMSTPAELIQRYDAVGIERAVVLPVVNPECNFGVQAVEDIIEMARNNPRFIPFCNIDPRAIENSYKAPLGEWMRYYRQAGCKGIGEVCANLPFLDPLVQNLFRHAEENELPITFHISAEIGNNYGLYDDPGLPQLEECLKRFPKLKFFGHSQTFWAEIAELDNVYDRYGWPKYPVKKEGAVPRLMRKYENLYGDLSAGSGWGAVSRDETYGVKFMEEFQDRLMFGTDICSPNGEMPLVDFMLRMRNEGKISETVFQKIARENAIRILGL